MKKIFLLLTMAVFIALNINHAKPTNPTTPETLEEAESIQLDQLSPVQENWHFVDLSGNLEVGITSPILDLSVIGDKTVYYIKIGNTISKLVDKEGYIIAAKRLGMETIQVVPDGKVYKTVSLDLNKSDEALKDAIEVKLDEIIVAN